MNQKAKKIYIASWKPQTMPKLHKFESAGPAGVACEPGESEGKEAGLKWASSTFRQTPCHLPASRNCVLWHLGVGLGGEWHGKTVSIF